MGRPPKEYVDVVALEKTISILNENGKAKKHTIYYDRLTEHHLLRCPSCFYYFQYINESTSPFLKHRGSNECKKFTKQRKKTEKSSSWDFAGEGENECDEHGEEVVEEGVQIHRDAADHGRASMPTETQFHNVEDAARSSPLPPSSPPPLISNDSESENESECSIGILFSVVDHGEDGPGVILLLRGDSDTEDGSGSDSNETEKDDELSNPCTGQPYVWTAGSIWATFAYQQVDNGLDWRPVRYLGNNKIVLRSKKCKRKLVSQKEQSSGRCSNCVSLLTSRSVDRALKRAKNHKPHTPYKLLTPQQLIDALHNTGSRVKQLEAENTSLRRVILRLHAKKDAWQSITMKIAHNDIPGASRAIEIALTHKESPAVILDRLKAICQGLYRPQGNWSPRQLDVAFLVKALGGPLLLYTLQKAEHFPSRTTLSRRKVIPELMISVDKPSVDEMKHNISQFLGESSGRKPPQNIEIGLNLMIDGIALEEVPRYDRKCNVVLGLCHEHSGGQKKVLHNFPDLSKLRLGLERGHWHRSKDGIVLAIAPVTAEQNYEPIPLLLIGSCKSETEEAITQIISDFLEVFNAHPMGRARWGPIVEFSTDGEAGFRGARFNLGLKTSMDKIPALKDALPVLSKIKGFNLHAASDGMVSTCNPKHIFKHLASMVRSDTPIQVGNTIIKNVDVKAILLASGMPPEKVDKLLNPLDKQNVPVAVTLIEELARLDLSLLIESFNPSEFRKASLTRAVGKLFSYLVAPFTNIRMTLSQQIRSLATYMYTTFALELNYGGKFMKGFLYGDSMSIIKAIFTLAARLQKIDPNIKFYIIFIGTDRIEGLFSYVRTQDHARNADILQLSHKISIAAEIAAVFERHPDLYRGHRRRNVVDKDGVDHVNPMSWLGDVTLASVDLLVEILLGLEDAKKFLKEEVGIDFDFEKAFAKPGVDVLRPQAIYVGSRAADRPKTVTTTSAPFSNTATPVTATPVVDEDDDLADENPVAPNPSPTPPLNSAFVPPSDEETEVLKFDSNINPTDSDTTNVNAGGIDEPPLGLIEFQGKLYHKSSMVATHLISDSARKVTIRPFRAAGFTMKNFVKSRLASSSGTTTPESSTSLLSSDLGTTLIRTGNMLCLAVVEIQHFFVDGTRKPVYEIIETQLDEKSTVVVGYVMDMTRLPDGDWLWTKNYVPHSLAVESSSIPTDRDFTISISGPQFFPISGTSKRNTDSNLEMPTWIISHTQLQETLDLAWDSLNTGIGRQGSSARLSILQSLPVFHQSQMPYRAEPQLFFSRSLMGSQFQKHSADEDLPCRCCNTMVKLRNMRDHVGKHILRSLRKAKDTALRLGFELGASPCGWCGLNSCHTQLVLTKQGLYSVLSDCEYHHEKMVYATAAAFNSKRRSSTNVPIPCTLCMQNTTDRSQLTTFWKYNLFHHMLTTHLTPQYTLPPCPPEMVVSCHIQRDEELYMGIAHQQIDNFRELAHLPGSDDIEVIESDLKRRERSASNVTGKGPSKKKKKK